MRTIQAKRYEFDPRPDQTYDDRPALLTVDSTAKKSSGSARLWQELTFTIEAAVPAPRWSASLACGDDEAHILFALFTTVGYLVKLEIYSLGAETSVKAPIDPGSLSNSEREVPREGGILLGRMEGDLNGAPCVPSVISAELVGNILRLQAGYSLERAYCHTYDLDFDLRSKRFSGRPLDWKIPEKRQGVDPMPKPPQSPPAGEHAHIRFRP